MQSELKPCPFCSGIAERIDIEDGDNAGGSFVHCTVCDASGNIEFEFKENFISNWNRRAEAALSAAEPQPAPSVAVKAIESVWKYSLVIESSVRRGDGPDQYAGVTEALRLVKEARSALCAQVQDVAERKPLDLNITEEWFAKRAALEGDHEIGAGRKLTACIDPTSEELAELYRIAHRIPAGWQLVPVEPTEEMIGAGILAYDGKCENSYRAMLAAAPAKQEGVDRSKLRPIFDNTEGRN